MKNSNSDNKVESESKPITVKDFGSLGKITKENLDAVFDNDLSALARRRRREFRRRK